MIRMISFVLYFVARFPLNNTIGIALHDPSEGDNVNKTTYSTEFIDASSELHMDKGKESIAIQVSYHELI